jgi:hypothetical protein
MAKNENGQVAIASFILNPHTVEVNGKVYNFESKYKVIMAWVDEADVPAVFKIVKKCCGGSVHSRYYYASDAQARIWSGLPR